MQGTYIGMLSGKDYDLVELRYVCDKVVYAGAFRGAPAMLALEDMRKKKRRG
jgi:hypothetical protein